jgi:hypothetical protein
MKLNQLAIVAAGIADAKGWHAVTAANMARTIGMHPVSVARIARAADVATAARLLVIVDPARWPRAYVETELAGLSRRNLAALAAALKEIIG